jgi:hypothetical protein
LNKSILLDIQESLYTNDSPVPSQGTILPDVATREPSENPDTQGMSSPDTLYWQSQIDDEAWNLQMEESFRLMDKQRVSKETDEQAHQAEADALRKQERKLPNRELLWQLSEKNTVPVSQLGSLNDPSSSNRT